MARSNRHHVKLPPGRWDSQELLAKLRATRAQAVAPELVELMDRGTQQLLDAGHPRAAVQVGMRAPDFALSDAHGREVRLSTSLRAGPSVVVFFRGNWCVFCTVQLRGLQHRLEEFRDLGASVLAISGQTTPRSAELVAEQQLAYEVLSDPGLGVAQEYGLVYDLPDYLQEMNEVVGHPLADYNVTDDQQLPTPAVFVVDRRQVVRYAFAAADYMYRADPEDILTCLRVLADEDDDTAV